MNQRLRALVADDEPLARARLLRLLAQFPEIEVVADCANGQEAIEQMHSRQPDVVFLDIQMPGVDGFDVIDSLPRERRPGVVLSLPIPNMRCAPSRRARLIICSSPSLVIDCARRLNDCASARLWPRPALTLRGWQ